MNQAAAKYPVPEAALARHIACVGETGSGKTHDTKTLVEHVAGLGYRVCVLDTIKSDWWGITSSATGKRAGLPFTILGGPRGHVPLHSGAGKAIGQLVGEGKLPLSIVDMADFEPGGPQKFFQDFAQSLWRHTKGVVYLVIEEAHEIAPKERAGFGAENMAIHWAKKLATGSRTKGIRLVIASQRTQAVHNALLGSCGTLMAHSLSLPADQKPVIDWLKANLRDQDLLKTITNELAFLPQGTAWVCCAKDNFFKKIHFPKIATFDNTATPDKDADDFDVATAHVDADALRAIIGDAIKDAEANDPKALKAQVAALKRELATKGSTGAKPAGAFTQAHIDRAARDADRMGYRRGFDEGQRKAIELQTSAIARLRAKVNAAIDATAPRELMTPVAPLASIPPPQPHAAPAVRPVRLPSAEHANGSGKGTGAELRILRVLAARAPARFTIAQWATLSKLKRTGGTWGTYVSRLRVAGFIEESGDLVGVTPAGIEAAGDVAPPPAGSVIEGWKSLLGKGPSMMIDEIVAAHPDSIDREDLATRVNLAAGGGTFGTYLSRLRSNGLVEVTGQEIRANEILFNDARQ